MSQALAVAPVLPDLRGSRVLLAEDEFVIAFGLQIDLEEMGANVSVVDSVADGLPQADRPFDVALLDVRLADGDVYPLADALQARGVPLVFHSAHADVASLTLRYPGARALRKPCAASMIAEAVSLSVLSALSVERAFTA